jgi:hypothetical protein
LSYQVEDKPTAAYLISLIGGILSLIVGLIVLALGAFIGVFTFGIGFVTIGALGLWITVCSIIVIFAALRLNAEPLEHSKWGAIILVFSLIGAWSILDFIGGILALTYTPNTMQQQQPYYQPPATRICTHCGYVVDPTVRFCPHCGASLT